MIRRSSDRSDDVMVVWGTAGMPTGNIEGNRIGRSLRYTDRRGVTKIQSNTSDFTDNTPWQGSTDGINGTYLILDPSSVFEYETNNNPSAIETNISGLNGYPSSQPSKVRYNSSVVTNKELFDFYHGTAFYDEERQEYRMFFVVNHRTDKRWGWRGGSPNSNFDFSNTLI